MSSLGFYQNNITQSHNILTHKDASPELKVWHPQEDSNLSQSHYISIFFNDHWRSLCCMLVFWLLAPLVYYCIASLTFVVWMYITSCILNQQLHQPSRLSDVLSLLCWWYNLLRRVPIKTKASAFSNLTIQSSCLMFVLLSFSTATTRLTHNRSVLVASSSTSPLTTLLHLHTHYSNHATQLLKARTATYSIR